jgi:hypothetical protein
MGSFSKTVLPFNTAFPLQRLKPFTAAIFVVASVLNFQPGLPG